MKGHIFYFDDYYDQSSDKQHTKYLLSQNIDWGLGIKSIEKEKEFKEIYPFLDVRCSHKTQDLP